MFISGFLFDKIVALDPRSLHTYHHFLNRIVKKPNDEIFLFDRNKGQFDFRKNNVLPSKTLLDITETHHNSFSLHGSGFKKKNSRLQCDRKFYGNIQRD